MSQEWGFMVPVEAAVSSEPWMRDLVMQMAEDSLRSSVPQAQIVDASFSAVIPDAPLTFCPEGYAMCGVLLTFEEPV